MWLEKSYVEAQGTKSRSVLISGASIAGPALANWLNQYGFDVTVVERADAIRSGGYPIDVRGTAIDVVERMGVLPQLRAAHVDTGKLRFVDADGNTIATITPEYLAGGTTDRHIELPRGELASILYDLTRDGQARYRFNDSIEALHDDGAGVDVRFKSGAEQRFDIVIGADGMHSNTRALVFGPEAPFIRYLGFCFNLFSMPNNAGLSHEAVVYAEPGRVTGVYAVGDSRTLLVFLNFAAANPRFSRIRMSTSNASGQRKLSDMAGRYFVVPSKPCSALMTSFSTRSARSTCRAGRPAESRWSATPLTRRHSCRDRAPAWRLLARMCLPANCGAFGSRRRLCIVRTDNTAFHGSEPSARQEGREPAYAPYAGRTRCPQRHARCDADVGKGRIVQRSL